MSLYEIENLINRKRNKDIYRLGIPFSTKENDYYFYDTGTGKVIELDHSTWEILYNLFNHDTEIDCIDQLYNNMIDETLLQELNDVITKENLFKAVKPKRLYTADHCENLVTKVHDKCKQVIIEVTGKCNMRCRYCIYNDHYVYQRAFNKSDSSIEIAKASIDYIKMHGDKDSVAITFYGGEPLINFELVKWSINYGMETIKDREVSFSLTTNLTLMTDEIAEYLATVPNMSIVVSMDGPKDIQNAFRVFANGDTTYEQTIKGLQILSKWLNKHKKTNLIINSVFTPPYSISKIDKINDFFKSLDYLPNSTALQLTYPSAGTLPSEITMNDLGDLNSIWKFIETLTLNKTKEDDFDRYVSGLMPTLVRIHNRYLTNKVYENYPFNACCVPCARRIYVDTKGDLYLCERVGNSPSVGNILKGINIDIIKKNYIDDYNKSMIDKCSNCWAIRLCTCCYIDCYDNNGIRKKISEERCLSSRKTAYNSLVLYHRILKYNLDTAKKIAKVEIW